MEKVKTSDLMGLIVDCLNDDIQREQAMIENFKESNKTIIVTTVDGSNYLVIVQEL